MIFQLCNICSISLHMATARTWFFGCALTWNMIMLSRKLVSLPSLAKNKNTRHFHGETQRTTCAIQTGKCLLPGTMKRIALWFAHCALENMVKRQKGKSMQRKRSGLMRTTYFCHVRIIINYPFPLGTHLSGNLSVIPFWVSFKCKIEFMFDNLKCDICVLILSLSEKSWCLESDKVFFYN